MQAERASADISEVDARLAALVEEEAFPLTRKVLCTGQIQYGDRVFRCHARKTGHGALDFFGVSEPSG